MQRVTTNRTLNVLIYGFERFGTVARNPAEDIVHSLGEFELERVHIHREVLPVSYRRTRSILERLLQSTPFDLVLGFGVAAGSAEVRVERLAYNRVDMLLADIDGTLPETESILPGGVESVAARIDIGRLMVALAAIGAPCVISDDAGRYLCNYAFYLTCGLPGAGSSVGFVHVPMATEFLMGKDTTSSMPLHLLRTVARVAVSAALEPIVTKSSNSSAQRPLKAAG